MNRMIISVIAAFSLSPVLAADVENGAALHEEHCVSCHSALMDDEPNRIYTREDRKVDSFSALQNQVQRCEINLDLQWFDDELADTTAYLDATFYHFEATSPDSDSETPQDQPTSTPE